MKTLLVVSMMVVGCGDDGGMVTPELDASPAVDAAPDAPPDAGPTTREGIVIISELRGDNVDTTASATFADGLLFGGPASTAGPCGRYPSPDEVGLGAGTITVTGGLSPISLVPSTNIPGTYEPAEPLPDDLFAPGASLAIAGAGGTVPAFSGTVVTPAPIANPVIPAALSRSTPPTITWTAGTGDEMWLWMMSLSGSSADLVWCRMPDTGSFAVPAAAMALIPTTSTGALVFLWRTNATAVTAGAWNVSLTAADAFGTDMIPIAP